MAKPENPSSEINETHFPDYTVIVPPHRLQSVVSRTGDSTEIAMDVVAQAEEALDEIKDEFLGWMNEECAVLEAARIAIHRNGSTPQAIETMFAAAHDIRGDAAIYGYPLAGMIAGTLCKLLEECPPGSIPLALVDRHVDAVRAVVREGVNQVDDETGGEIHRRLATLVETHLAQFAESETAAESEALPVIESPRL